MATKTQGLTWCCSLLSEQYRINSIYC